MSHLPIIDNDVLPVWLRTFACVWGRAQLKSERRLLEFFSSCSQPVGHAGVRAAIPRIPCIFLDGSVAAMLSAWIVLLFTTFFVAIDGLSGKYSIHSEWPIGGAAMGSATSEFEEPLGLHLVAGEGKSMHSI